jgi:ABC-type sugar transport system ATPase subunit
VAGEPAVDVAGAVVPITPPAAARLAPGQPVVLGLRPEHLALRQTGMAATVRAVEWLGNEQHVIVETAGGPVTVALSPDHAEPVVGSHVHLQPDRAAAHLFDPDTAERIG